MSLATTDLILASNSPRRRELLAEHGYEFRVEPARIEEVHLSHLSLAQLTRENAALKAWEVAERFPDAIVLGADTLVSIEGTALAKPADLAEARAMLRRLSGKSHEVCTAVCLVCRKVRRAVEFEEVTEVTFRTLTDAEIDAYFALVNPLDKAGAYGAQEHGERIIASMRGNMSTVVGLPMERLARELAWFRASLAELCSVAPPMP